MTALTAAGALGLHLSADLLGAGVAVLSLLLPLLLRANVSPVAS